MVLSMTVSLTYALAQKYPNAARKLQARKNGPDNSFFLREISHLIHTMEK
jgi:hypothetical protein